MVTKFLFAAAAVALSLSANKAFAESEGNGNPFPFQSSAQLTTGPAFVADNGSDAYPNMMGSAVQPSSLAQLEPASGSEASVQTTLSLPRGAGNGTVATVQAQRLNRYLAAHSAGGRVLEVGNVRPKM